MPPGDVIEIAAMSRSQYKQASDYNAGNYGSVTVSDGDNRMRKGIDVL